MPEERDFMQRLVQQLLLYNHRPIYARYYIDNFSTNAITMCGGPAINTESVKAN